MSQERANDRAWRLLDEKYQILKNVEKCGVFRISASQIKEFREPRLATKFDHVAELPKFFRENNLSILSEKRGTYVIGRFPTFQELDVNFDTPIQYIELPPYVTSIDARSITSESMALNAAYASGIVSDFLDEELLTPTISGRQSSGSFCYYLTSLDDVDVEVSVENAQIEIDAGYEGVNSIALLEAKQGLCEDFMLRQLYYPYRTWEQKTSKRVRPVFLTYANRVFYLYEYEFVELDNYCSAKLVKRARYSIEPTAISFDEIQKIFENTKTLPEPDCPFPQANSLERVLNLCERLDFRNLEQSEISEAYEFVGRQAHYYSAAAGYLGLVKKDAHGRIVLDEYGIDYLSMDYHDAQLFICERIFEHKPFNETFRRILETGEMPDKTVIASIIEKHTTCSGSTPPRRASTVISWMKWIHSLVVEAD